MLLIIKVSPTLKMMSVDVAVMLMVDYSPVLMFINLEYIAHVQECVCQWWGIYLQS